MAIIEDGKYFCRSCCNENNLPLSSYIFAVHAHHIAVLKPTFLTGIGFNVCMVRFPCAWVTQQGRAKGIFGVPPRFQGPPPPLPDVDMPSTVFLHRSPTYGFPPPPLSTWVAPTDSESLHFRIKMCWRTCPSAHARRTRVHARAMQKNHYIMYVIYYVICYII
jgi:hypothetical protein